MPSPRFPRDAIDTAGLVAATIGYLLLIAFAPMFAFAVAFGAAGVLAERELAISSRFQGWWDQLRSRFGG